MKVSARSAGRVVAIHISLTAEGTMTAVDEVRAVPGQGLEGDRYSSGGGTSPSRPEQSEGGTGVPGGGGEAARHQALRTVQPSGSGDRYGGAAGPGPSWGPTLPDPHRR